MTSEKRLRDMSEEELNELYLEVQKEQQVRKNRVDIHNVKHDFIASLKDMTNFDLIYEDYLKVVTAIDSNSRCRKETAFLREKVASVRTHRLQVTDSALKSGTVTFSMSRNKHFVYQDKYDVDVKGYYVGAKSTPSGRMDGNPQLWKIEITCKSHSRCYSARVPIKDQSTHKPEENNGWSFHTAEKSRPIKILHIGLKQALEENLGLTGSANEVNYLDIYWLYIVRIHHLRRTRQLVSLGTHYGQWWCVNINIIFFFCVFFFIIIIIILNIPISPSEFGRKLYIS